MPNVVEECRVQRIGGILKISDHRTFLKRNRTFVPDEIKDHAATVLGGILQLFPVRSSGGLWVGRTGISDAAKTSDTGFRPGRFEGQFQY